MAGDVLHVLSVGRPEGASVARMVRDIADGAGPAYRFHAAFLHEGGPLLAELERAGVETHLVPWSGGIRDPAGAWRFLRFARRGRFAIAHLHLGGRALGLLARFSGAKVIAHLHGFGREDGPVDPRPIEVSGASIVIATSKNVAACVTHANVHVVHPGIDVVPATPEGARRVGVVGAACRLVPIKGLVGLVHAIAALRAEFPRVRLEIAGRGPEEARLRAEVRAHGLDDRVRFVGWLDDIRPWLATLHAFAAPSLQEGFGVAVLEALAEGVPVAASDVGGMRELVADGVNGYLVPAGDVPALAHALGRLLADPRRAAAMGGAGRERAARDFTREGMRRSIYSIYDRATN
jgi:glycosyltransferase involved in cell wall biosynthesis